MSIGYHELHHHRETARAASPIDRRDVRVTIRRRAASVTQKQGLEVEIWAVNPEHLTSAQRSVWLNHVLEQVIPMLDMAPGWNSHGARMISLRQVEQGIEALVELLHSDAVPPKTFATASGGVNFEWSLPQFNLEVMAEPDEGLVISYEGADGWEWDGPISNLPDPVHRALKQLAQ